MKIMECPDCGKNVIGNERCSCQFEITQISEEQAFEMIRDIDIADDRSVHISRIDNWKRKGYIKKRHINEIIVIDKDGYRHSFESPLNISIDRILK